MSEVVRGCKKFGNHWLTKLNQQAFHGDQAELVSTQAEIHFSSQRWLYAVHSDQFAWLIGLLKYWAISMSSA